MVCKLAAANRMETRRSARIRGRAAPSPRSSSPAPPVAAAQELPPQPPELDLDPPPAVEEESRLEAVGRLPAFVGALLRAHNRSLDAAAQAVASLERALVKPLEPVWDELAEAAECGILGGAPARLGPDISLSSMKLPALKKLASALGLHATGAKPELVARLGPVVGESELGLGAAWPDCPALCCRPAGALNPCSLACMQPRSLPASTSASPLPCGRALRWHWQPARTLPHCELTTTQSLRDAPARAAPRIPIASLMRIWM